jgi:hypothetical protein
LILITGNVKHFADIPGLSVENWIEWEREGDRGRKSSSGRWWKIDLLFRWVSKVSEQLQLPTPHNTLKMLSLVDSVIIAGSYERFFVKKDAQYVELLWDAAIINTICSCSLIS